MAKARDAQLDMVLGRLAAEGLTFEEPPAAPWREPVALDEVLRVAAREPRLMEALPALVLTRPGVFTRPLGMPADLAKAVKRLRGGGSADFRGHRAQAVRAWVKKLARGKTRLTAFRLTEGDRELLLGLSEELGLSGTDVVRHALRVLAANPHGE
jgi:hypothetical protein